MDNNAGVLRSLMGSDKPSMDTASIPDAVKKIMLLRKMKSQDKTPKYSREDAIKDMKSGGYKPSMDSAQQKMAHDEWMKHIDQLGYELTKKKSQ